MVIYQKPKLLIMETISLILNWSSSGTSAFSTPSDLSSLMSITAKLMKEITPMSITIKAKTIGAVTEKFLASGMDIPTARAVPKRAIDICIPIAKAISLPLNQRTTAFEMVIPVASVPTPKMAKPKEDQNTCDVISPTKGMCITASPVKL